MPTVAPGGAGEATAAEAVLAALGAAVRAVTPSRRSTGSCSKLADGARDLAGARYAAIGIPEPEGDEFARFVTVGMSDELIERLGPLPRTHGLLDAMLAETRPVPHAPTSPRTRASAAGGRRPIPTMRSFLGVPIVSAGDIIGAFYLTDKEGGPRVHRRDEAAVVLLAVVTPPSPSRTPACSRTAASWRWSEERARLARELHDAMSQSLFSLSLSAETAASLLQRDPVRPRPSRSAGVRSWRPGSPVDLRAVVDGPAARRPRARRAGGRAPQPALAAGPGPRASTS